MSLGELLQMDGPAKMKTGLNQWNPCISITKLTDEKDTFGRTQAPGH